MHDSEPHHANRSFPLATVRNVVAFEGAGLHSGRPVSVRVHPGRDRIHFRAGGERVLAAPNNVTGVSRCTALGPVATIEHLMSALAAFGVTDAEVEVEGGELPALDGSSLPYAEGLRAVGTETIGEGVVDGPFARVYEKAGEAEIAIGTGEGHWRYQFYLGDRWVEEMDFEWLFSPESYVIEVAPARTIVFEEEIAAARAQGLGLGLTDESVVRIARDGFPVEPRFADEPARHKLLDMMGDLYLAAVPPQFLNVVGERNGHAANVRAAAKLAQAVRIDRNLG